MIKSSEVERSGLTVRGLVAHEADGARRPEVIVEPSAPSEVGAEASERIRRVVQAMLAGFAQQRRELLHELHPYVVRIAVEVARRIVRRELTTDPGMIARTAEVALEQVTAASRITVRVHPLDAQVLQATISEIISAPDQAEIIEIVPDGTIDPGGCVVESDRGIVDARLRTQFEEMQARLLGELEREGRLQ
ncbi:MAG: FliH/SctL family protein [Armatimonadota bacterium]